MCSLSQPLVALSPTIPSGNELYIILGNSLKAKTIVTSVKFETLGVKIQEIDPEGYINALDSEILKVLRCESGLDNSKRGKAGEIGIAQFMPTTWEMFNEIRGTNLDIYNTKDQIEMIIWAFQNGYQNHWTCYRLDKNY